MQCAQRLRLDGRVVQGARLKFEYRKMRGFESHFKQVSSILCTLIFVLCVCVCARVVFLPRGIRTLGNVPWCAWVATGAPGLWSSGMILL